MRDHEGPVRQTDQLRTPQKRETDGHCHLAFNASLTLPIHPVSSLSSRRVKRYRTIARTSGDHNERS
jgi:hypothetical protein